MKFTKKIFGVFAGFALLATLSACTSEEPAPTITKSPSPTPSLQPVPDETAETEYVWEGCGSKVINLTFPEGWQAQSDDYMEKNVGLEGLVVSDADANNVIIACIPQEGVTLEQVGQAPPEEIIPADTSENPDLTRTVAPGVVSQIGELPAYQYVVAYDTGVTQTLRVTVLDEGTPESQLFIISGTLQTDTNSDEINEIIDLVTVTPATS